MNKITEQTKSRISAISNTTFSGISFCRRKATISPEDSTLPPNVYLVSVGPTLKKKFKPFCSASIIAGNWLVTAAHCIEGKPIESIRALVGQLDFNNAPDEKIALVTHRKEYTNAAYDLGLKGYDLTLLKMNKSYSNFFSIDEIRRIQHLNMVIPEKLVSVFLTKSILGSGKLKLLRVEMKQANCSKQKEIWCDNCCEKANICLIEKRLWLNLGNLSSGGSVYSIDEDGKARLYGIIKDCKVCLFGLMVLVVSFKNLGESLQSIIYFDSKKYHDWRGVPQLNND